MWDINKARQMKAFARVDGAYLGLIWIASFTFFVMQYHTPLMGMVSMAVSLMSLFFIYSRITKFRIEICDGELAFSKAYIYSLLMFFYASLIMGLAQYIYFRFIDGGYLINATTAMMDTPEVQQVYGMTDKEMKEALSIVSKIRPVDIVINIMSMNIFASLFLSFPLAFMARKNKKN